jgi:hypothetical protein
VGTRLSPVAVAVGLVLVSPLLAQSPAPAFAGRYKLVLTFARGCPSEVQVGPQSVLVDLVEATVTAGSEVSGQSASPSEAPEDIRFVLLRQGDRLHGAFGARDAPYVGFRTLEGYRIWMMIMADGTATTTSGRAAGSGTAFGEIDLSRPGDVNVDSIGACGPAVLGHSWALEPA